MSIRKTRHTFIRKHILITNNLFNMTPILKGKKNYSWKRSSHVIVELKTFGEHSVQFRTRRYYTKLDGRSRVKGTICWTSHGRWQEATRWLSDHSRFYFSNSFYLFLCVYTLVNAGGKEPSTRNKETLFFSSIREILYQKIINESWREWNRQKYSNRMEDNKRKKLERQVCLGNYPDGMNIWALEEK